MSTVPSDSGRSYDFCLLTDHTPTESMVHYDHGRLAHPKHVIHAYPPGVMWYTLVEGPNHGIYLCSRQAYHYLILLHILLTLFRKQISELGGEPRFPTKEEQFPDCCGFNTDDEASAIFILLWPIAITSARLTQPALVLVRWWMLSKSRL